MSKYNILIKMLRGRKGIRKRIGKKSLTGEQIKTLEQAVEDFTRRREVRKMGEQGDRGLRDEGLLESPGHLRKRSRKGLMDRKKAYDDTSRFHPDKSKRFRQLEDEKRRLRKEKKKQRKRRKGH